MPLELKPLLDYQFVTVEPLARLAVVTEVRQWCEQTAKKYHNRSVIVSYDARVALWKYFLLFHQLYPVCPEIAFQLAPQAETAIVLATIYQSACLRPAAVQYLPTLVLPPAPDLLTSRELHLTYDFTTVTPVSADELTQTVSDLRSTMQWVEQLTLTGSIDLLTGLMVFGLWRQYAQQIKYAFSSTDALTFNNQL